MINTLINRLIRTYQKPIKFRNLVEFILVFCSSLSKPPTFSSHLGRDQSNGQLRSSLTVNSIERISHKAIDLEMNPEDKKIKKGKLQF